MRAKVKALDLDRYRRLRRKTLAAIAAETGLKMTLVWRVFHLRVFDLRKIIPVCKSIGISPHRMDWDSFLIESTQPAPAPSLQSE